MTAKPRGRIGASLALALTFFAAAAGGDAPASGERVGMFNAGALESTSGAVIFEKICQGCHMPDARGASGAAKYPALAGDRALASKEYMAVTILEGRRNMPPFGAKYGSRFFYSPPSLTHEQVAAVINYVRTHFGNRFSGAITTAEIDQLDPP